MTRLAAIPFGQHDAARPVPPRLECRYPFSPSGEIFWFRHEFSVRGASLVFPNMAWMHGTDFDSVRVGITVTDDGVLDRLPC